MGNIIISAVLCSFNAIFLHFASYFASNRTDNLSYFILQFLDYFRFIMPWFVFYHGIRLTEKAVRSERDKNEAQMHLKVAELENLKTKLILISFLIL